ncbi:MAG: nickel insertion protein, partial [Polyangiaceae bacterium]
EVDTAYGPIPVKISEGPFGPAVVKPEFDACVAAATRHGVPVRLVLAAAVARVDNR